MLKKFHEQFRIEDMTTIQDDSNDSVLAHSNHEITVGPFEFQDNDFYVKAIVRKVSTVHSARPMIYGMDLELFHQVSHVTPKFTFVHYHYAIAQFNGEGDGGPDSLNQLIRFKLTPHPKLSKAQDEINDGDKPSLASPNQSKINPLAKDIASQINIYL